ncbi:MAG: glycerate kinase, partial [Methyloceanibacter sp.]
MTPEVLLKAMFKAGVNAALPSLCVPAHLPPRPKGRTIIIGAGKASGAMAKALEDTWDGPLDGLVVTRYGYRVPTERLEVIEAAHPVPDEAGRDAAKRIFELVQGLTEDDLVLCLISGGGSSLLALPAEGVTLEDKQAMNKALLASGATISEMNTVRKHLSAIKGGRLARAAYPAKVIALMISDVPGDDASIIASGPTVPDPSTNEDALGIIEKYGIDVPDNMRRLLDTAEETPKPGDPCFENVENIMIATPQASLEAAAEVARKAGVTPVILGDSIEGESRDVALVHAGIARQCAMRGQPEQPPCVLISGGETTITLKGKGKGGRNTEFLLALAIALDGMQGIYALAGDTDGVDG